MLPLMALQENNTKSNGSGRKVSNEGRKTVEHGQENSAWQKETPLFQVSFHATIHKNFLSAVINGRDSGFEDRSNAF